MAEGIINQGVLLMPQVKQGLRIGHWVSLVTQIERCWRVTGMKA